MERFDDEAVRRILARARELAPDADAPDVAEGIEPAALIAAAEEVGYDPVAVADSIALERLGSPDPSPSVFDRVSGPAEVVVELTVDRSAPESLDVAEAWLADAHRMACRRPEPGVLVARRRSDVAATVGRSLTELRGDGRVGRIAAVRVDAVALSPAPDGTGRSALRLTADRSPTRRRRLTAGTALGGTGVAVAVVGVAEAMFAWPLAAATLIGGGAVSAGSGRRHADRVEADVEALAAALEAGERPVGTLRRVARAARRSAGSS